VEALRVRVAATTIFRSQGILKRLLLALRTKGSLAFSALWRKITPLWFDGFPEFCGRRTKREMLFTTLT